MVKIEGTLAEIRDLFLDEVKKEVKSQAKKAGKSVVKSGVKRVKSKWQKYMAKKSNQIKFKSGSKKGRLDLAKMGRAYRKKNGK